MAMHVLPLLKAALHVFLYIAYQVSHTNDHSLTEESKLSCVNVALAGDKSAYVKNYWGNFMNLI
jgi:hypothetical protein